MPASSFAYGHRACLLEKGWPNQEIRELVRDDLPSEKMCDVCGEVLKFNQSSMATQWMPHTDHTTPTVFYNQNHLRVKRTHASIMAAWQFSRWRGWTTDKGIIVESRTEPIRQGRFLVALVTLLDRSNGFYLSAYFAIAFDEGSRCPCAQAL